MECYTNLRSMYYNNDKDREACDGLRHTDTGAICTTCLKIVAVMTVAAIDCHHPRQWIGSATNMRTYVTKFYSMPFKNLQEWLFFACRDYPSFIPNEPYSDTSVLTIAGSFGKTKSLNEVFIDVMSVYALKNYLIDENVVLFLNFCRHCIPGIIPEWNEDRLRERYMMHRNVHNETILKPSKQGINLLTDDESLVLREYRCNLGMIKLCIFEKEPIRASMIGIEVRLFV